MDSGSRDGHYDQAPGRGRFETGVARLLRACPTTPAGFFTPVTDSAAWVMSKFSDMNYLHHSSSSRRECSFRHLTVHLETLELLTYSPKVLLDHQSGPAQNT